MCQDGRVEEWKRFMRWKCLRGEDAEVVAVGGGRGGIRMVSKVYACSNACSDRESGG